MFYLLNKNLISDSQYGFLPGRSTTIQLLKLVEDWTNVIDQGDYIDTVYFDFMKAFDKVPHRHLLHKDIN